MGSYYSRVLGRSGLRSFYKLDETGTTEPIDYGSLGKNGVGVGGLTKAQSSLIPSESSTCYLFDGSDDGIEIADLGFIRDIRSSSGSWSVEVTMRCSGVQADFVDWPICSDYSGSGSGYYFKVDTGDRWNRAGTGSPLQGGMAVSGFATSIQSCGWGTSSTPVSSFTSGTTFLLTLTRDSGGVVQFYKNGAAPTSGTFWNAPLPDGLSSQTVEKFRIGRVIGAFRHTTASFKGYMQGFSMYNVALSAAEVAAGYTAWNTVSSATPVKPLLANMYQTRNGVTIPSGGTLPL